MSDFLMRDDAPLGEEEWKQLDEMVVSAARRVLVGRRFIELTGPFGFGTQVVPLDAIEGGGACVHDAGHNCGCGCEDEEGECKDGCDVVQVAARRFIPVPVIHKDFVLSWRDLEAARQPGGRLDLGPAAVAATMVARAEDELIFKGRPKAGIAGLLNVEGRTTSPLGDWSESGGALEAVVGASQKLAEAGFYPPYALVVSADLYFMLQRVYRGSGRLEQKLVESIADGGIYRSPTLPADKALLISTGSHHLDLAVAQDMITAYLGQEGMDHRFRVLESLVLRIKRPAAICVME